MTIAAAYKGSLKKKKKKKTSKKPRTLAPPLKQPSRKQARKLTTAFHRLTQQRDAALQQGDAALVHKLDDQIQAQGGREAYQRASQTSTSFHSTSQWVLGVLARKGWLHGRVVVDETEHDDKDNNKDTNEKDSDTPADRKQNKKNQKRRRPTQLLEVGAINTELLDASGNAASSSSTKKSYPNLHVRALDLHAMDPRIEQADFLQLPLDIDKYYDVLVCSMVLNCVTSAEQRGDMLWRLAHFTTEGGLVFVTLPRTCLQLSPYLDTETFQQMLQSLHLPVVETKVSPKIAFFVCQKKQQTPRAAETNAKGCPEESLKWTRLQTIRTGRKYKNPFAIILPTWQRRLST